MRPRLRRDVQWGCVLQYETERRLSQSVVAQWQGKPGCGDPLGMERRMRSPADKVPSTCGLKWFVRRLTRAFHRGAVDRVSVVSGNA